MYIESNSWLLAEDPTKRNNLILMYSNSSLLAEDPNERNNLADQMPDVVEKLKQRMAEYKKKYVPPHYPKYDPNSNPKNYGGAWTPGWC
jgi:hypothetical protein